jgi:hypothetical protein
MVVEGFREGWKMTIDHSKFAPIELLHVRYAENRIAMTDWKREDKGVHLDGLRDEYLEEGDRWRGWNHAIRCVYGAFDPEDEEEFGLTEDQRNLADLLDQKAALRVEAGKIKRAIFVMGERLIKLRIKP